MDKKELRRYAKEVRHGVDIARVSEAICLNIAAMAEFEQAKNILLFYPKAQEINLLGLCEKDKNFYLPRVEGEKLLICPYDCNVKLKKSEFNVLEPCSVPVSPDVIDFAVIPCLMADMKKFRLGYGGGFYDRFIPSLRADCKKVVVCAAQLVTECLPTEHFDKPVDFVATEQGVF